MGGVIVVASADLAEDIVHLFSSGVEERAAFFHKACANVEGS